MTLQERIEQLKQEIELKGSPEITKIFRNSLDQEYLDDFDYYHEELKLTKTQFIEQACEHYIDQYLSMKDSLESHKEVLEAVEGRL